jgi:hypothetical protein
LFCFTGAFTAVDLFVSQFADFTPALLSLMNFNGIRWDVSSADINCPHLLILVNAVVFNADGRFTVLGYFKWFLAIEVSLLGFASSYFVRRCRLTSTSSFWVTKWSYHRSPHLSFQV